MQCHKFIFNGSSISGCPKDGVFPLLWTTFIFSLCFPCRFSFWRIRILLVSHLSDNVFEHETALEKDLNGKALWMLSSGNEFKWHTDSGISASRVSTNKHHGKEESVSWTSFISAAPNIHLVFKPISSLPLQTPVQKANMIRLLKPKDNKCVRLGCALQVLCPDSYSCRYWRINTDGINAAQPRERGKLASACIINGRTEADIREAILLKVAEGRPG